MAIIAQKPIHNNTICVSETWVCSVEIEREREFNRIRIQSQMKMTQKANANIYSNDKVILSLIC